VWYTGSPEGQYGWEPGPDGITGGLYAGYNWQMSNGLVLGLETDFNANDGADEVTYIENYFDTFPGYWDGELRQQWSGSTRLRVGYAVDRMMGFVTGGVAYTGYEFSISTTEGYETPEHADGTLVGWTIGAGLEYAINDNWRVRGAYQFADYGNDIVRADYDSGGFDEYDVELQTHTVTLGVSYNF
jgi:outer membrane immunogenic protein